MTPATGATWPKRLRHRVTHCGSCDAPIVFAITTNRRAIPVDANPNPKGNLELREVGAELRATLVPKDQRVGPSLFAAGVELHRSHFATCNEPDKWRRDR